MKLLWLPILQRESGNLERMGPEISEVLDLDELDEWDDDDHISLILIRPLLAELRAAREEIKRLRGAIESMAQDLRDHNDVQPEESERIEEIARAAFTALETT
jgi:hypothetical protein